MAQFAFLKKYDPYNGLDPDQVAIEGDFDPEGRGYDYSTAEKYGIQPDETGHWPSRVPTGEDEGMLLKGRNHPTFYMTEMSENQMGNEITQGNGRYYSRPSEKYAVENVPFITNERSEATTAKKRGSPVYYLPNSREDMLSAKKEGFKDVDKAAWPERQGTTTRSGMPAPDRKAFRESIINELGIDPSTIDPIKEAYQWAAGYRSSHPGATEADIERVWNKYYMLYKDKKAGLESQIKEHMTRFDKESDRIHSKSWWYEQEMFKDAQRKANEKEKPIPTAMFNEVEDLLSRKWFGNVKDWGEDRNARDYKMVPSKLTTAQKQAYDRHMLDAQQALKRGATPAEAVNWALQSWQQNPQNPVNIAKAMGAKYDWVDDKENPLYDSKGNRLLNWVEGFIHPDGKTVPYKVRTGPDGKTQIYVPPDTAKQKQAPAQQMPRAAQPQGPRGIGFKEGLSQVVNDLSGLFSGEHFKESPSSTALAQHFRIDPNKNPAWMNEAMQMDMGEPTVPSTAKLPDVTGLAAKYNAFLKEILFPDYDPYGRPLHLNRNRYTEQ